MPDITMCATLKCRLSHSCYRHKDNGTIPDEYRQAYLYFGPDTNESLCRHFICTVQRAYGLEELQEWTDEQR